MRILILTGILGLPLMALGQTAEPQQTQGQTNETQTTAPTKGKKTRPEQEETKPQAKPETGRTKETQTPAPTKGKKMRPEQEQTKPQAKPEKGQTPNAQSRGSSTSQTNVRNTKQTTTVNKQEFRSRHSEVFNLGHHPKQFFIERFGANHFRLIGNTYFVFVDGCWVAVDVEGFVFIEQVICAGDPGFIVVD